MQTHLKLGLTALIAVFALTAAISTAAANRLRLSEQEIEAKWTPLTFTNGGSINIRCNLTLLGRLHSATITKTVGSLIGYINHARFQRPCTGGTFWAYNGEEVNEVLGGTLATSLPWHITYERFEGTLPSNISNIRILLVNARFLLRATVIGITLLCIYRTETGEPAEFIASLSSGVITSLRINETLEIEHTAESSGICPSAHFTGSGTVTNLAGTSSVTITLV